MTSNVIADILSGTILFAVPLMLVALGGMFSERSGIINIALEGIMVIGALFGCLFLSVVEASGIGAAYSQLWVLGAVLIAAVTGAVFSLLLAFASIQLKADQTIGGTALNMMAPAIAIVLTWVIQGQGQSTILIPSWVRITQANFGITAGNGFLERFIFKSLFLTTPLAFILLIVAIVALYKTRLGLRLRSCGEHPQAADSVGINVYKMRYLGVSISGFLGGIGGFAFTVAAGSGFQSSVAGYGFLALAVMIFGNWKPLNILGASLFFALFKVIGSYAGSIPFLPQFEGIKSAEYIYLMLPYIVTMIVLILTSKKSRAPKAEGIPYDKGGR
ncbi:MAG TPA: ABC transporter permease [Candidatus Limiplasma sp.]|nr:ABC transporter permease [Candidatus Limiplasma sp.]HPS80553.1 ABC transporter permease [Candidatus Limiplasma sp.]